MDTAKYKTQLEEMLQALTTELQALGVQNPDVKADWIATADGAAVPDPNDAADRVEDWGERRATLSVLETRYNNIRRALTKIEDGTFGICEISGHAIEADRLDANPAARTCKAHLNDEAQLEA